jgi:hypothetical protein
LPDLGSKVVVVDDADLLDLVMSKEDRMQFFTKMDCVNLQGVWPTFPQTSAVAGHLHWAAGIYRSMVEEEAEARRRREGERRPTPREVRISLLKEVERRIVERDDDDLFVVLAA